MLSQCKFYYYIKRQVSFNRFSEKLIESFIFKIVKMDRYSYAKRIIISFC